MNLTVLSGFWILEGIVHALFSNVQTPATADQESSQVSGVCDAILLGTIGREDRR
jgi:hypothetical protein